MTILSIILAIAESFFFQSYSATGRVIAPELNINVRVERSYHELLDAQSITDNPSTACIYNYGDYSNHPYYDDSDIISDHNYQGFANLHNAKPGMHLYYNGHKYVCEIATIGNNTRDSKGYPALFVNGESWCQGYRQGLTLYTCRDCYTNISISRWKRL